MEDLENQINQHKSSSKKENTFAEENQDAVKESYRSQDPTPNTDLTLTSSSHSRCDNHSRDFEDNPTYIQTSGWDTNGQPFKFVDARKASRSSNEEGGDCPSYFGIKSYLHHFYCPPDQDVLDSGEFTMGDIQLQEEPKIKNSLWTRVVYWTGINFILFGTITMLAGYLIPQKETVVDYQSGYTVVDRRAVTFNNRLMLCQVAGLAILICGTVVVVCYQLVTSCKPRQDSTYYYVMAATLLPQSFVSIPLEDLKTRHFPFYGTVKPVQTYLKHTPCTPEDFK